jgi:DNA invertase Pin-like site-specific DNA recombinase
MPLTTKEMSELKRIVMRAQELIEKASAGDEAKAAPRKSAGPRKRRTGKDLAAFRRQLKAERKAGVPVAEIAAKHGISTAYVYQLG